ncbi:MAG TPA: alpha/beta hydrolase [Sporichthyaceae bacterium]|jgi:pimeloyl-ACP methyl ester carboxylesterase|nr:alpha/beta hydrolase [Sporichthyaceae bacterium]
MKPLRGLASGADAITRCTTAIQGPILLVGHSGGGAAIFQAPQAVKHVKGPLSCPPSPLDRGESYATVQELFPPPLAATTGIAGSYDAPGAAGGPNLFSRVADFHRAFCADLPEAVAAPMAVSQRPLSAAAPIEKAISVGRRSLPTRFLVGKEDQAISPECQRFMANRIQATTEPVDGSRAALIAHPNIAGALLGKAVATT